jgi:hypothetical protein
VKAIITGVILAAGLAVASALLLRIEVQRSTTERFQTEAVRL